MEFLPQNIAQSLYDLLAKLDDLKASLDAGLTVTVESPNINVTVQGCGGCSGGGGAGMVESPPELAPPPGSVPDGYTDTDQWLQRRCGIVEQVIYPNWQRDLEQISNLDLSGLTIGLVSSAILIVVLTPIPFDDILLLAAIIVGFLLIGIAHSSVMNPAIDYVANLDPCILASASSPQVAVQALLNDIDAQEFDVLIDSYTKGVLRSFVTNDLVNVLFAPNPPLSASVTSANCDACASDCVAEFQFIADEEGWEAAIIEGTPSAYHTTERLHVDLVSAGTPQILHWRLDVSGLDCVSSPGDSFVADIQRTGGGQKTGFVATTIVVYDDDTTDEQVTYPVYNDDNPHQTSVVMSTSKQIKYLDVRIGRSALGQSYDMTIDIRGVVISLANAVDCPSP